MMYKASRSIEEVPYRYIKSSIKFQGITGWKIDDLSPIWARLLGRSQQSNPPICLVFIKKEINLAVINKIRSRQNERHFPGYQHYGDGIMSVIASQITSLAIVYSTIYSGADQRKHQSSASMAFVRGIHRGPVNSPHKWPVTRKMFPFDDVIMGHCQGYQDIMQIIDNIITSALYCNVMQDTITILRYNDTKT